MHAVRKVRHLPTVPGRSRGQVAVHYNVAESLGAMLQQVVIRASVDHDAKVATALGRGQDNILHIARKQGRRATWKNSVAAHNSFQGLGPPRAPRASVLVVQI